MTAEPSKFDKAFVEMMTAAARQAGIKGDLEITILRPKKYEQISKSSGRRQPRRGNRTSVQVR